ncbi:MAG: MBL fold metallo-hydrolase, partial [Rhodospirillales bacterium]|nr:MBL fold metallo-hydrolase [Rhodospirillales bacterium]
MRSITMILTALAVAMIGAAAGPAGAANVKVTPLGSHDGEFCRLDRALIFEDPDGTRILYDAGRTVSGPDDPRLGKVDAVLLSHVHGDHLGDRHIAGVNAGACGAPEFAVAAAPNSNSVNIVMAKQAKFLVGGEMASFFSQKIKSLGGDPKLVQLVRFGAMRKVGGVSVASVPA